MIRLWRVVLSDTRSARPLQETLWSSLSLRCVRAHVLPSAPPPAHKSVDRMCVQEKPVGNTMLARVRDVSTFDSYDEMLGPQGVDRVQQFLPGFTGTIAEAAEMYRASYTAVKYKSYGLEDGAIALHVEPLTDH